MRAHNIYFFIFIILPATALINRDANDESILEDARLSFEDLVLKYGYPVETHKVITADNYILRLHRIPHGRECGPDEPKKAPVLLQHGLLSSSICWVLTGPEKGLGFILADNCYDVWLGNSRGNHESRGHRTLSTKSSTYWDFSWHEMGLHDLPAFIEYILGVTNQSSLHYIGHSQGTTQFFVFNSIYPEYSNKIRLFQALAPVAYINHMTNPLFHLTLPFSKILGELTKVLGPGEFLPTNELLAALGTEACRDRYPTNQIICSNIIFILCGFDQEQLNTTLLPVIVGHHPAGASTKQLIHYAQNMRSGSFRQYDYSWILNTLKYGSFRPPSYNLKNVLVPVVLHYAQNDYFVGVRDLNRLASEIPNLVGKFLVPFPKFNHIDFLWATDVKALVYDKVLEMMEKY